MNRQTIHAVILYNELSESAGPDERDVLDQVALVAEMLNKLGIESQRAEFSLNLQKVRDELSRLKPDFVFNLVESVNNRGNLIFLAPSLLNSMGIPFTGGSLETIFLTSSKTLTKQLMQDAGIPTPFWYQGNGSFIPDRDKRYIVKPIWEDGSLGLDEDSIFEGSNPKLAEILNSIDYNTHFIEEFVDGREFNISILAGQNGPQLLPPAEIIFRNYAPDKPHVVGYSAKWIEDSFEYINTNRTFDLSPNDQPLLSTMGDICLHCWKTFRVNGYARVDFRVDNAGNPWVLEINVNPCISRDSGFYAACMQAGIPFDEAVRSIIADIPFQI
ncbi:MAG TPA: ATP-grasp domain-containing protein [Tenuifilaceae bacterium]|jgi:D-alanine-D-alanine ligase|nr:ATP-grasp domain-containing protein [Bacteroidales bacterium]HNT42145.1 ATP-grasp domain-containing protein [Tenuifilaceae bacterium]MBP8644221.1 ATP-grasp domain-containing protein [Bacteroidales bacterium]NLI86835.1 ATP-grasp domain-containing protein [Bacteroidales bacterium]HNY09313.1 ATP-grasp domain-containing protein [Tenuifilaceae bacterium]